MKTRYKILPIIIIVIIAILGFLFSPSVFGQPPCNDEREGQVMDKDCRSINNWDWIELNVFHCFGYYDGKWLTINAITKCPP